MRATSGMRNKLGLRMVPLSFDLTSGSDVSQTTPALDADYWIVAWGGTSTDTTANRAYKIQINWQSGSEVLTEDPGSADGPVASAIFGNGDILPVWFNEWLWLPKGNKLDVTVFDIAAATHTVSIVFWVKRDRRRKPQ